MQTVIRNIANYLKVLSNKILLHSSQCSYDHQSIDNHKGMQVFGMDSIKDSSMALNKAYIVWQTQVAEFLLVFVHIFIVNITFRCANCH